jgi:hypothetical protein
LHRFLDQLSVGVGMIRGSPDVWVVRGELSNAVNSESTPYRTVILALDTGILASHMQPIKVWRSLPCLDARS